MTRPDVKVAIKLEKSTGARATFDPTIKLCGSREACDSTSALGEGERGGGEERGWRFIQHGEGGGTLCSAELPTRISHTKKRTRINLRFVTKRKIEDGTRTKGGEREREDG